VLFRTHAQEKKVNLKYKINKPLLSFTSHNPRFVFCFPLIQFFFNLKFEKRKLQFRLIQTRNKNLCEFFSVRFKFYNWSFWMPKVKASWVYSIRFKKFKFLRSKCYFWPFLRVWNLSRKSKCITRNAKEVSLSKVLDLMFDRTDPNLWPYWSPGTTSGSVFPIEGSKWWLVFTFHKKTLLHYWRQVITHSKFSLNTKTIKNKI
jgi:hypothetical protein